MRVIQSARKRRFFTRRSRSAYRLPRRTVSFAFLNSLERPPRLPLAAFKTFLRRARVATLFFTLAIALRSYLNSALDSRSQFLIQIFRFHPEISFLILFSSAGSTSTGETRCRFRFAFFFVR